MKLNLSLVFSRKIQICSAHPQRYHKPCSCINSAAIQLIYFSLRKACSPFQLSIKGYFPSVTCLGVTHSPIHRKKYLHINSCVCWPCQGASRQMPPNTAMEDAVLSPTLLYLNKRLLKFCFQLTEGMPEPPCSPKVHNGKRKHWFLSSK